MRRMDIFKFKAECHAVMKEVRITGKPILITRFGKPVVEVLRVKSARTQSQRVNDEIPLSGKGQGSRRQVK